LLALLVGCGLRRAELATLELDRIQQREGRWVLDVKGKGSRLRSVPFPAWAKAAVHRWRAAAAIEEGRLFRAISQAGTVGSRSPPQTVYLVVREFAGQLGLGIAPHNLRRIFARIAQRGHSPLEQIQLSLASQSSPPNATWASARTLPRLPATISGFELTYR
jgi:integrase